MTPPLMQPHSPSVPHSFSYYDDYIMITAFPSSFIKTKAFQTCTLRIIHGNATIMCTPLAHTTGYISVFKRD
jgi:hypothetical protein